MVCANDSRGNHVAVRWKLGLGAQRIELEND